jgi:hypothetical protein
MTKRAKWIQFALLFLGTLVNAFLISLGYQKLFERGYLLFLVPVLWVVFCWWPLLLLAGHFAQSKKSYFSWIVWSIQLAICAAVYLTAAKS